MVEMAFPHCMAQEAELELVYVGLTLFYYYTFVEGTFISKDSLLFCIF